MPDFVNSGQSGLVSGGAHGYEMPERVNAQLSSNSRIELLASAKKYAEEVELAMKRFGMDATVKLTDLKISSVDRKSSRDDVRVEVAKPEPVVPSPTVETTVPVALTGVAKKPNGIVRTWRKHSETIIITTVVGIVVTVVGGLILYNLKT